MSLTHLGEALVVRMANTLRADFLDLCGLLDRADRAYVDGGIEPIAHGEVPLSPYSGYSFDGAHKVDLVVLLDRDLGVPFEVKLGDTRMTRRRVDEEWLNGCGLSHEGRRIRGNMMSVLERKFPDELPRDDLKVRLEPDRYVKLTREWFVIAKRDVLDGWREGVRPAFSPCFRPLAFESIVEHFGGKEKFNDAVHDLLSFDYYDTWIANTC